MTEFKIYFEMFGHKMQTTIQADSESEARIKLQSKIIIHQIVEKKPTYDDLEKDVLEMFPWAK